MSNKLGLTLEERTVFYRNADNVKQVAEIRQFETLGGFLQLHDPFLNSSIDFYWDSSSSKWRGTGIQSGYTTEVSIETPLTKKTDSNVPGKAKTVSRFPS